MCRDAHIPKTQGNWWPQGFGTEMMKLYVGVMRSMKASSGLQRLVLLAKSDFLPFYMDVGFSVRGLSDVVHGMYKVQNEAVSFETVEMAEFIFF